MKRRIVSLILSLAMVAGLLPLSGCRAEDDSGAVTRGEWITMLSEGFGMDSYIEDTPYYSDITSQSDLFPFVQSAAEWDVLSIFTGETLDADKKVTREEVASTAAIAAGCDVSDEQFDDKGRFHSDASVQFAVDHGILQDNKGLSKNMTLEECEEALSAARSAYMNAPFQEKDVAVPAEDLVDLTDLGAEFLSLDNGRVTIPSAYSGGVSQDGSGNPTASINTNSGVVEIGVGETFVTAPTEENPSGTAFTVESIEEIDGEIVFTTGEPTLYDLFDELDVHMTVAADPNAIIWTQGVQSSRATPQGATAESSNGNAYKIDISSDCAPMAHSTKSYSYGGYSRHFEFGNGSFEKNWSNHNSSAIGSGKGAQALENSNFVYNDTPSIDDFKGSTDSWTKNLEIDNSFSGGYKITGDISINTLTVTTNVEYKRSWFFDMPYGIERASIQVNSDISSTLRLEGNLSERLHIATVPIPIAATGLAVTVDLYLYADATGSLVVTASLGSSAKVEYSEGRLKHTAESQANASVEAAIEINFGAELAATLDALGIVKIVDVGAKAGGVLTASAHVSGSCKASEEDGVAKRTYQESMDIKADLYVPTINIYAGGSNTLIGSLGLSGSWDIMTKDKGAKHISIIDEEWVFWEETVLADEDGNILDSESSTAGDEDGIGATDPDRLDLRTYVLTLNGESKRLELDLAEGEAMQAVTWSSENPGVAQVDETGLVSPVSTGYTIITVSLRSDPAICVKCAVYVEEIGEENWEFLPADTAVQI